jgi:hypothetical protein
MMTTTVTTKLHSSRPRHTRRNLAAALAGAAIVASTLLVVNRVNDSDSPRVANHPTNESTLGVTEMYGAFNSTFIPSDLDRTAAAAPPARLAVNEALSQACASGHPDACAFAHTWVTVNPLPGMGDVIAGAGVRVSNPASATPLQGIEVAACGVCGPR